MEMHKYYRASFLRFSFLIILKQDNMIIWPSVVTGKKLNTFDKHKILTKTQPPPSPSIQIPNENKIAGAEAAMIKFCQSF